MSVNFEIQRISWGIIDTLRENEFFEDHPFVGQDELEVMLIQRMTEKYESTGEMLLTDKEFLKAANDVPEAAIAETLGNLIDKEAINMSIGEDGEIYYSANPEFDRSKLNEDDEQV